MADVKKAGYFSFSVDSTSNISHTDQLTLIIRCVSPVNSVPSERFITFLELKDHSGVGMADLVHKYLTTELQLDFNKCRGQSYDNAANMAGRYNGMQQKILERKKFAKFIPCAGHSLNLLGCSAVDYCLDAVNCFGFINEIYTFFSASTKVGSSKIIFATSIKGAKTFVRYQVGCTCKSHGSYFGKLQCHH